jgi:2-polyprenyl-3-methyl-5-hydroxy-6-metoxy-1,4-benzoquinol methylase
MVSPNIRRFVAETMPFSNWGQSYFDIRLMELMLADSLFGNLLSMGGQRALDIGCGIGLACVVLAERFAHVDGTDIDEIGVAFRVDRPAPMVGSQVISKLAIQHVHLHCGDTMTFLGRRPEHYDLIFSHFVLEHVAELGPLCDALFSSLKPGGRTFHIVPNTHDTIIQLLVRNLEPLWPNLKRAWRARRTHTRCDGRLEGSMFTPITHSEFLSDYRAQFEVNASERYLFPLLQAGFRILDIKPMREHAYGVLAEKPRDTESWLFG